MGAVTVDCAVDVVGREHDAMQAACVKRRVLRLGGHSDGGVLPGQLHRAMPVGGTHHRDLATDAAEPDREVRPRSLDLRPAIQLQAQFCEEGDCCIQIIDDDGNVVHPLNCHVVDHFERRQPASSALLVVNDREALALQLGEAVLYGPYPIRECPTQPSSSLTISTGSRVRCQRIGLPRTFLSVTLGSSIVGFVGEWPQARLSFVSNSASLALR